MKKPLNTKPLIAIVGPTASGKTELAIKIAKKINGVIISADSRQIYKGIPIGTNQPDGKRKKFLGESVLIVKNIPHFFIGNFSLNKKFNVALYQKTVYKLLPKIWSKRLVPIICGGTGLYVSAVLQNYQFPKNKKKISIFNEPKISQLDSLVLGLNPNRQELYHKINKRVDVMIKKGLLKEVNWLKKNYPNSPALTTIGYHEFADVKNINEATLAIDMVKQHSRNFAKRQITWFKKMPNIKWVTPKQAFSLSSKYIKAQTS